MTETREEGPRRQVERHLRALPNKHAVRTALADRQRAELWRGLSLGTALFSLVLVWLCLREAHGEQRILVLDAGGNLLAGPAQILSENRDFFTTATLCGTNAALQRSPEGFDLYEMLSLCFSPRAVQSLEDDWQGQREDARARNLQQKPVIETITDPVKAGETRVVKVGGRIIRAGAYAGRSFYEETPFAAVLSFVRNPNLAGANAYPWICDEFELKTGAGTTRDP